MRIPRDLSGPELVRLLKKFGYTQSRQTGSHMRLTTELNGEHHITIPNHSPFKSRHAVVNIIGSCCSFGKDQGRFDEWTILNFWT